MRAPNQSISWGKSLDFKVEKRLYPRVPCRLDVACDSAEATMDGIITNLSLKGMRIETSHHVRVGKNYQLAFSLPVFPRPIRVESRATHCVGERDNREIAGFYIR